MIADNTASGMEMVNNQGGTPAAEEQQDHQAGQRGCGHPVANHVVHR